MKISIISTVYNKEQILKTHIDSLLEQDYPNIEYIFVNDGSTDKSLNILKKILPKRKNIIIINQKNQGVSYARKNGFLKSTGELIYFVDSDDTLYSKNAISNAIKNFKNNPQIDFSINYMINSYDRKNEIDKIIYSKQLIPEKIYSINELHNEIFRNSLCCKIIKRELIKEAYFINKKVFEDCYLTYCIFSNAKKFYYSSFPIYMVNRKAKNDSVTNNLNVNRFEEVYEVLELCKNFKEFNVSINKQYTKCYLDQLNYSLKLNYNDRKEIVELLKSKQKFLSKEYVILNSNKKTYSNKNLYLNMFTNSLIHSYLKTIDYIKKILRNLVIK